VSAGAAPRPMTVTVATWLVGAVGVLAIVMAVGSVVDTLFRQGTAHPVAVILCAVYLVAAVGILFLARGVWRGRNSDRLAAFVLFGLCGLWSGNNVVVGGSGFGRVLNLVGFAAIVLTVVLLALPQSNAWFHSMRRPRR
jgi:hypothetical protein